MIKTLFQSTLSSLKLIHRGKVRDIYAVDDERLLIIQTDRLSAFTWSCRLRYQAKAVLTALSTLV
jgi:phosphoribosylaminoimidazole-succinocarboxamide synthase